MPEADGRPRREQTLPRALVVIWIDWYAYHVARFRGLQGTPELAGRVTGIELVGGVGVHQGLRFREDLPADLPVTTLLPEASWQTTKQSTLARLLWRELTLVDAKAVLVPGYYTLPAMAAALWARAHDRQSILMTESTAYDHVRQPWKEWAKGLLLRIFFDSAVTGGTAHRRYLDELGFRSSEVGGCYDVVDNAGIAAGTADLRATREPGEFDLPAQPYFLYVGRLAPEKNLMTLLEAWMTYRETGGTWPLVLGGDGPEAAGLQARVQSSPYAGEVMFTGHKSAQELLPLYAFAGCFVLPSSREPWGLVVNEAMAAGLPVLVSERCGSAEDLVQEGRNGFTFAAEDRLSLARLLRRLAEISEPERKSMGQQSVALIRAYTPQRFGAEIAKLISGS